MPLYLQLQQLIRNAINGNVLTKYDVIPAECALAVEYGMSRATVRRAIGGLVEEGLLSRRRGSGTFVAIRVEKGISKLSSFSENMIACGRVPSNAWIVRAKGIVTPEESLSLGLSPGSSIYRFTRMRYADDVTVALEYTIVAGYCLPSLSVVQGSLYAALELTGHRPVRALQRLRAIHLSVEHSNMLNVSAGDAGLFIERRGFLRDERTAEFTQSFYRGDAYDVVTELNGS